MNQPKAARIHLVVAAMCLILLGVMLQSASGRGGAQAGGLGVGLRINEVMFYPEAGDYEWVELINEGPAPIDISGYGLTNEDGNWYEFPQNLPPVPVGAFVVVVFDGLGSSSNDVNFNDNAVILHTPTGMVNIFEDDGDQVALYTGINFNKVFLPVVLNSGPANTVQLAQTNRSTLAENVSIVDFVAWGDIPGRDANNAAAAGIWLTDWVVSLGRNTGFGEEGENGSVAGEPIGLTPGEWSTDPAGWRLYLSHEATPGGVNPVPGVAWSNTMPGMTMRSDSFGIAWEAIIGADGYHFQLDETPDFTSPYTDTIVTDPAFVPGVEIPAGLYYWRVQVNDSGATSGWSQPSLVESWLPPATSSNSPLAATTKILQTASGQEITWQLQHKDTRMLLLENSTGFAECGRGRWDSAHGMATDPCEWNVANIQPTLATSLDKNYCARASLSMFASYYGASLSQDRISYHMYEEQRPPNHAYKGVPEYDFQHDARRLWTTGPELVNAANWALNGPTVTTYGQPSFEAIKGWIDGDRPVIANVWSPIGVGGRKVLHVLLITGYEIYEDLQTGATTQFLYWLDPYQPPPNATQQGKAVRFVTGDPKITGMPFAVWVGPAGPNGAPNIRSDEDENGDGLPDTIGDVDQDGIVDFDERYRFPGLSYVDGDSDHDGVRDKQDVREYVFDKDGRYRWQNPDIDGDGLRKESDPDNDNGGSLDGCEDSNFNGKYEPGLGETSNFIIGDEDPSQCNPPSDEVFVYSYSATQNLVISDSIPTNDGGYVSAGGVQYSPYAWNIWIMKTNSTGEIQWETSYNIGFEHDVKAIHSSPDGGYFITGLLNYSWTYQTDLFVLKVSSQGSFEFVKTFGGSDYDFAGRSAITQDGGLIIVGAIQSYSSGWILRIDANGNVIWQHVFSPIDTFFAATETEDGSIVAVGRINFASASIVKLSSSGDLIWARSIDGIDSDAFVDITQTVDGNLVVVGETRSFPAPRTNGWAVKLDTDGNLIWQKAYGEDSDYETFYRVVAKPNGNLILIGEKSYNRTPWLVELNHSGNIIGEKLLSGIEASGLTSVYILNDNRILVSGFTNFSNPDGFLGVIGDGFSGCSIFTTVVPPTSFVNISTSVRTELPTITPATDYVVSNNVSLVAVTSERADICYLPPSSASAFLEN